MKTIITYGTFDLFHIGHVRLLERARAMGDRLVVGVSTDEFNHTKGKKSIIAFEDRCSILKALRHVDEVFPEEHWNQKRADVLRYGADVLVMGNDWEGKFDELRDVCEVKYFPRTVGISSSEIRSSLKLLQPEKFDELKQGLDHLKTIIEQMTA